MTEIKVSETKEIKSRRKYDGAFKRQAVDLWLSSGKTARQVAAELGIPMERLGFWKKRLAGGPASASQADLQAELAALRRENAYLRQQRDIFKKTLGILFEPPSHANNGLTRCKPSIP